MGKERVPGNDTLRKRAIGKQMIGAAAPVDTGALPATLALPPMPPEHELKRQLSRLLESMNIPKAKMAEIMTHSNEKKWQLICSQNMAAAANQKSPSFYLDALSIHIKAIEKQKKKEEKEKVVTKEFGHIECHTTRARNIVANQLPFVGTRVFGLSTDP